MAVIEDPVVYVPVGAFAPKAHYKVYKGKLPSTAGYLSEGQAQVDGSISGKARGVELGTEICVVAADPDGTKIVVVGKAGGDFRAGGTALDQTRPAPSGMNIPDWETPSELKQEATRAELYARAQELDVPGRGEMNKEELAKAVSQAERALARHGSPPE